jgi:hypothetical protein
MKYFGLISIWTLSLISLSLLSVSRSITEADPTDDFSFTLQHSPDVGLYRLMGDRHISQVLSDRLDLFPRSQVGRLSRHITTLCQRYRLDPAYVLSLIEVESAFHVKATSAVGASGLMQLMLPTANFVIQNLGFHFSGYENFKGFGLRKRTLTNRMLMDPFVNTALGIAYLAWLRDHYQGYSPYYVLAAYNVGPARMDELLARKSFRPKETLNYFRLIRRGVPGLRFYKPGYRAPKYRPLI